MLKITSSTSTGTPILEMFKKASFNIVTVQTCFFGAGPPFAHIRCAPNILQVAESVQTAVNEPTQFVFLCSRKMNIMSMYREPPLEVMRVDSGGFHHVAAHITSTLWLVSWTMVVAIPMPTPSWAIIIIIHWIITTTICLLHTWGKDFRQVFSSPCSTYEVTPGKQIWKEWVILEMVIVPADQLSRVRHPWVITGDEKCPHTFCRFTSHSFSLFDKVQVSLNFRSSFFVSW